MQNAIGRRIGVELRCSFVRLPVDFDVHAAIRNFTAGSNEMKLVRSSVLASAVGIALSGMGVSSGLYAAPAASLQASSATTSVQSPVGRYIVTFSEPGLVNYKGDVPGLQRTAPQTDLVGANSSRKLDANSSAANAYKAYLVAQRQLHVSAIEQSLGRSLTIHFTYDVTRNAISAEMSAAEAAAVAHVGGVASVSPVMVKQPDTFRGPTFIGANTIWDGTGVPSYATATRGQGIKVGVIDTGANSAHPSFANDPVCGFSVAHPKLHEKDCLTNDGSSCTGSTPEADPGNGHGVHTSSTAAGNTIDNTATPAPLLPDGVSMSGVAPCAEVFTYKVCDLAGCTDDAITAGIQNAITDQVDVINYSIGPTCGGGNPWADSLDFLAAEGADVFVAASAGNTRSSCTNPTGLVANNGPWMITVAASTQDQIISPQLTATGPGTPPALTQNVSLNPGSTTLTPAETVNQTNSKLRTYPTNPVACTASGGIPAGYFSDRAIAILRRGTCSFTEKITNAYNAGARIVVIGNNQAGSISMDTTGSPTDVAAFSTLQTTGDALIAFVDANPGPIPAADTIFADGFDGSSGATGNYVRAAIGQTQGDVLAAFSFRGPTPAPYDNLTKPDITGPGVNIFAALDASEGSYGLLSGTSMSSPHLAGAGALVRAVQPGWSPMEVKSAIQMTATLSGLEQDGTTPWNLDDVGSGRVDLTKATRAGLTLDETPDNFLAADPNGGSIDMRALNIASLRNTSCGISCTWTRKFKNRLNVSSTWTPTAVDPAGYHLTFSPTSFTVAPGFTQTITITATATGSPTTTLSYGRVDLHETGNHSPDEHLTVAIKGGTSAPPTGYCNGGVCNLQIDTLAANFTGIGCATYCGIVWLNRFTPDAAEYPITLTKIQTIFGAPATWNAAGDHINFYVYQDSDSDPSNGATLVGSYTGYTMPAPSNAFVTITLPTPIVVNGPGDLIIALTNPNGNVGLRPAESDSGPFVGRSWIGDYVDTIAGVAPNLADPSVGLALNTVITGFTGNWLIRAQGTNGGGRPVTLDPVAN
jgi:subtilisin family serine protease